MSPSGNGVARTRRRALLAMPPLVVAMAAGCASADGGPRWSEECQLGRTAECACVDGSFGVQHCIVEQAAYGPCECGSAAGAAPAAAGSGEPEPDLSGDGEPLPEAWSQPEDGLEPPPPEGSDPAPPPPPPSGSDVPATEHCAPVASWDPAWAQWEEEVLLLTNERRAQGASCGSAGNFGPAGPLVMNPILRCAARLHSMDMALRNYFSHTSPEGTGPFQRTAQAGYSGSPQGENIASGQTSPHAVVTGWMGSPGHCANIMRASFTEIGVGYYQGEGTSSGGLWGSWGGGQRLWTQKFGGSGGGGGGGGGWWPF